MISSFEAPSHEVLDRMSPSDLVKLTRLMKLTSGKPETVVGLIDGPVMISHPYLATENIREIGGTVCGTCARVSSLACMHGTFLAGILCGRRGAAIPAICPGCTLLVRPIFDETVVDNDRMPSASPKELAAAIIESIDAGASVINLSVGLDQASSRDERLIEQAFDHAAKSGVIVVAATGNRGLVGSSPITRHPWVIPVTACDLSGRPTGYSNLGKSIGTRGLRAPGDGISSIETDGKRGSFGGTSVAAPFVTGAIALLWSIFPTATATELRAVLTQPHRLRRPTVVPPLLDAWAAYELLARAYAINLTDA
jgi:subtilisin family serine protease